MRKSDTSNEDFASFAAEHAHQGVRDDVDEEQTDWARVQELSEKEVRRAAMDDPDARPMSAGQLDRMRRLPNPRQIRQKLGCMTQEQFARLFQIPVGTLRDWEQGVHIPDSTAKAFLRTIEADPVAVAKALNPMLTIAEIGQRLGEGVMLQRCAASKAQ